MSSWVPWALLLAVFAVLTANATLAERRPPAPLLLAAARELGERPDDELDVLLAGDAAEVEEHALVVGDAVAGSEARAVAARLAKNSVGLRRGGTGTNMATRDARDRGVDPGCGIPQGLMMI